MTASTDRVLPRRVTDRRASRVLEIKWHDGATSILPHAWLRTQCRCALCTRAARRGSAVMPDTAGIALDDVRPIADRGLNLVFSDGHDRGIYPWTYLRELGDQRTPSSTPCIAGVSA